MKTLTHPTTGKTVRFGRKRPVAIGPHLKLRNYLRANLPAPPSSCDFTAKAASVLADVFENDTLGDCVIAGGYHVTGVETANAGDLFHATAAQITKDYSAIGGYVPGEPNTDQGCELQTALNYWTSHGFANGTKLLGWLAVDATNQTECEQASFLFENLYYGMELPDAWVNPFPSGNGFTWDVAGAPDPENGHCIMSAGYDSSGNMLIDTWGMLGKLTPKARAEYAGTANGGELYVMLTPDQMLQGIASAPNGVAWTDLIADFDALGGHVPAPTPSPTPPVPAPPSPTPAAGVTLAQATAWALSGLARPPGPWLMSNSMAEAAVKKALAKNWPVTLGNAGT